MSAHGIQYKHCLNKRDLLNWSRPRRENTGVLPLINPRCLGCQPVTQVSGRYQAERGYTFRSEEASCEMRGRRVLSTR